MRKIGWYVVAVFVALHGIAHFVGTVSYFDPTSELYRTTEVNRLGK